MSEATRGMDHPPDITALIRATLVHSLSDELDANPSAFAPNHMAQPGLARRNDEGELIGQFEILVCPHSGAILRDVPHGTAQRQVVKPDEGIIQRRIARRLSSVGKDNHSVANQ
mgnify:FL=1